MTTSKKITYRQDDKLTLSVDDLNPNEKKVLTELQQAKEALRVDIMAKRCFKGYHVKGGTYGRPEGAARSGSTKRAYRTVLNSVRRLVAGGFIKKTEKGTYEAVKDLAEV